MTMRWSLGLRLAHCLTAGLVAGQLLLAALNAALYEPRPRLVAALVQVHISVGALVFAVTLCRLTLRTLSPAPPRPCATILRRSAFALHAMLYARLLLLPVTGYIKLAALDFSVTLFGTIALPSLGTNVPLAIMARDLHTVLAAGFIVFLTVHIAAALAHRRLDGTTVLQRMTLTERTPAAHEHGR